MSFFDFLDTRKSIAKWVAKIFTQVLKDDPQASIQDVIDFAILLRYRGLPLKPGKALLLQCWRPMAVDIFSFCHLLADVELLSHLTTEEKITMQLGGENIMIHTYGVMDKELIRLGFKPSGVFA